jgi:hypothetical protein
LVLFSEHINKGILAEIQESNSRPHESETTKICSFEELKNEETRYAVTMKFLEAESPVLAEIHARLYKKRGVNRKLAQGDTSDEQVEAAQAGWGQACKKYSLLVDKVCPEEAQAHAALKVSEKKEKSSTSVHKVRSLNSKGIKRVADTEPPGSPTGKARSRSSTLTTSFVQRDQLHKTIHTDFESTTETLSQQDFLCVRGRLKTCLTYMNDKFLRFPEAMSEFREYELNNTVVSLQSPLPSQDRYIVTCLEKERFLKKEDYLVVEKVLNECKHSKVSTYDENLAIEKVLGLIPIDISELKYLQQSAQQDIVIQRDETISASSETDGADSGSQGR